MQHIFMQCKVIGNNIKLPDIQLDRKEYMDVKKQLTGLNGKWVGGKTQAFVFDFDPTDLLERLAGGESNIKKKVQFFPTPSVLASKLVLIAEISDGHKILEPSAGQGAIVEQILLKNPTIKISVCEIEPINQDVLRKKYSTSIMHVGDDFLQVGDTRKYDRIIANPPFNKSQDIDHIYKMYSLLSDDGILVSMSSTSWVTSNIKKSVAFREWLNKVNAEISDVKSGVFKESGTSIATKIIKIRKSL